MKRCPQCRRDYDDRSLAYCLDDGSLLVDGPSSGASITQGGGESETAIFAAHAISGPVHTNTDSGLPPSSRNLAYPIAAVLMGAIVFGLGYAAAKYFSRTQTAAIPTRFSISVPDKAWFATDVEQHNVSISPDGRAIVFVVSLEGKQRLFLRSLDQIEARELAGTENAYSPFWAPDSRQIAFFAESKLKKIDSVAGGVQTICDIAEGDTVGSWGAKGEIVFMSYFDKKDTIDKVSAAGGKPETIYESNRAGFTFMSPSFLPDGQHFVFYQPSQTNDSVPIEPGIYVGSTDRSQPRQLVATGRTRAEYAAPGYLLFVREGTLLAQPFDASSLTISGDPLTIVDRITYFDKTGWSEWSVSQAGTLVYPANFSLSNLIWVDRSGNELSRLGTSDNFTEARLSPNGEKVAVTISDPQTSSGNIWIYDLNGGRTRFVYGPKDDSNPVWSPDGQKIAYFTNGKSTLRIKDANDISGEGISPIESGFVGVTDWSRDNKLIYSINTPEIPRDLMLLSLEAGQQPVPFQKSPYNEWTARFSPDGHFVAFTSNESGTNDVYVAPVDRPDQKTRVSPSGGWSAAWSRDGKEIFFYSASGPLMSASFTAGDPPKIGTPVALFDATYILSYDVSLDGKRFLVSRNVPSVVSSPLNVVTNWQEGLKR